MRQSKISNLAPYALALVAVSSTSAMAQDAGPNGEDSFFSHITVAIPFFSHHFPKDREFNDHNWGGVAFYALDTHFSLAGGDFVNSYRRNTAFAALSITPWDLDLSAVQIVPGALVGVDLTNGYKGYNPVEPLLAAATVKIGTHYFSDPGLQFLNRFGLLVTILPGLGNNRSTAANLALTIHL